MGMIKSRKLLMLFGGGRVLLNFLSYIKFRNYNNLSRHIHVFIFSYILYLYFQTKKTYPVRKILNTENNRPF